MSFGEFLRILGRWPVLLLSGVVLAVAAGGGLFWTSDSQYTRTGNYLLLSPVETEEGPANPFLQLGNGVGMAASVLAAKVSDGGAAVDLVNGNPGIDLTVGLNPVVSAPLIEVSVTDTDPDVVDLALRTLGEDLTVQLRQIQADSGAPESTWVTIRELTRDPAIEVSYTVPIRNGIGGAIGVCLLTLLAIGMRERRRRRQVVSAATALIGSTGSSRGRHAPPTETGARTTTDTTVPMPSPREQAGSLPAHDPSDVAAPDARPAGDGTRGSVNETAGARD